MVIIDGIFRVTDVVIKGATLLSQLPEKWYEGGSEIEKFKSDLATLSLTSTQWESQQKQLLGTSESPVYNTFLSEAVRLLDAERNYFDKRQRSWSRKLKRRQFPSRLTFILSNIVELVRAGPEYLAKCAKRQELLIKDFLRRPLPLPFGYDLKYVPLLETVEEVQRALEDTQGRQVITLYGEPGIGKSSLAKYIALRYQDSIQASSSCSFDGVQYLFCGQRRGKSLHQLRKEFFSNLGLGELFMSLQFDAVSEPGQGSDHCLSRYQSVLRGLLADRKLLIILDDVLEEDFQLLTYLICSGFPCKYLLTSQTRDLWQDASKIQMPTPTQEQGLRIVINHLQGLPRGGRNPLREANVEAIIWKILQRVDNHPFSLINIAIAMNGERAIHSDHWNSLAQNIFGFLDQNHHTGRVLVYERPYSLTQSVSASMMYKIESLQKAARDVLFVIAMFQHSPYWDVDGGISETLVRFLVRCFHRDDSSQSSLRYLAALKYLEDTSLVRMRVIALQADGALDMKLSMHSLRRHYIRQKHLPTLQAIASTILASSLGDNCHKSLVGVGDRDHSLAVVLLGACLDRSFIDEIALPFHRTGGQMSGDGAPLVLSEAKSVDVVAADPQQLVDCGAQRFVSAAMSRSKGEVPGGLQQLIDTREWVKSLKDYSRGNDMLRRALQLLVVLLNREGKEPWMQQAQSYAKKILMRLLSRVELDDASLALVLTMPYTRARCAACDVFILFYRGVYRKLLEHGFFNGQEKSLSSVLPKTWSALSDLIHGKDQLVATCSPMEPRFEQFVSLLQGSEVITGMLEFESEPRVSVELQKLFEVAWRSPDRPLFQDMVTDAFLWLHDSRLTFKMFSGLELQYYLPKILWKLINADELAKALKWSSRTGGHNHAYKLAMQCLKRDRDYATALLKFRSPSEWFTNLTLFRLLLAFEEKLGPESLLGLLSGTPEFQAEFASILKGACWEDANIDFTLWPESYGVRAARFWGNVAMLMRNVNLHDTLRQGLVKIAEAWVEKVYEYKNVIAIRSCNCPPSDELCICGWDDHGHKPSISMQSVEEMMRSVTIIKHLCASSSSWLVTHTSDLQGPEQISMKTKAACAECIIRAGHFYVSACRGQAQAFREMGVYDEALRYLNLGQRGFDITVDSIPTAYLDELDFLFLPEKLRSHTMLVKALWGDNKGAMDALHDYEQGLFPSIARREISKCSIHGNRAMILRLSGKFSEAVHEFDKSLQQSDEITSKNIEFMEGDRRIRNFVVCRLLEHRGYAKYLMGDLEGSKLDRESAQNLSSSKLTLEPLTWEFFTEIDLVGDFGYSLLQLPFSYQ